MNKNKLISIIIKKQTYKNTKPYLTDIYNLNEEAVKCSIQAIKEVLSTQYNAEAKLYAIRYLKDAFQKANPSFITQTEKQILPILTSIVSEQNNDKTILKYAGSSFTKTQQLAKFKSYISSFFRMTKQCIIKWAQWIPDDSRKFIHALNDLKRKKISLQFQFKYFRSQNEQLFKQYCEKNGVKVSKTITKALPTPKQGQDKAKDPLVYQIQKKLVKLKNAKSQQQILNIQNDFNEAINNYLQYSKDFQQEFMEKALDQLQKIKAEIQAKIKANQFQKRVQTSNNTKNDQNKVYSSHKDQNKVQSSRKDENKVELSKKDEKGVQSSKSQSAATKKQQKAVQLSQQRPNQSSSIKQNSKKSRQQLNTHQKQLQKLSLEVQSKKSIQYLNQKQKDQQKISQSLKHQQIKTSTKSIQNTQYNKQINKGQQSLKNIQNNREDQNQAKNQNKQTKDKNLQRQSKPQNISSHKKGPLIFQELQEESVNKKNKQKSSGKIQQKKKSQTGKKSQTQQSNNSKQKKNLQSNKYKLKGKELMQNNTISHNQPFQKQQDRIQFSQEEDSQLSEEMNQNKGNGFKKLKNLSPILEQSFEKQSNKKNESNEKPSLSVKPSKSPARNDFQQDFSQLKQKKGSVTHKLIQQNSFLKDKIQKLSIQLQRQKKQKERLSRQRRSLQNEILSKRQFQDKMNNKLKNSVPLQDYNKLKKQIQRLNQIQSQYQQQNHKLKSNNNQLQQQIALNNARKQNQQHQVSLSNTRKRYQQSIDQKIVQKSSAVIENMSPRFARQNKQPSFIVKIKQSKQSLKHSHSSRLIKQDIDPDYINNLTHVNNIHSWLNKNNILLFKKSILKQSEIFYRDDYTTISSMIDVYTQNNQQFISVKLAFQFKALKQVNPLVRYKNCQQLDIWSKPLTGQQLTYHQELAIRLHINPLKIIKAELRIIEALGITFLLPFVYYNFLRIQQFSNEQFESIYGLKAEYLIKSKIVQWNSELIKDKADFNSIFKFSIQTSEKLRFCLSEGINDQIFMGQLQFLRNNKFLIKILPIPHSEQMVLKSKELIQNLLFLFS